MNPADPTNLDSGPGGILPIQSLEDPRVAPYRALKDRDLVREGNLFMAEGEMVVRRLLGSGLNVRSILSIDRKADEMAQAVAQQPHLAQVPVYSAPAELVNQVVGFRFHSGVMACAQRPAPLTIDQMMAKASARPTFVILPKIASTDNLCSLIRTAAGFGCDGMILGPESCDPYYRQAVRVSMGAVFKLPVLESADLKTDLDRLREVHKISLLGTVLSDAAIPLPQYQRNGGVAILLGNEFEGLSDQEIALCTHLLTIPMKRGTDSLNVSAAAAVFLYELTR